MSEPTPEQLREAYAEGHAAALRGEEAAPGCTAGPLGHEWLRGYTDGAQERGAQSSADF